ncbi:MAG: prolipoprotein diacylglyceryl transferase [Lachnospiraceae bacterium]|nr:prolipoprotein diacylglyceryl transferase [Lachnospiraceae bacterium]
MAVDLFSIGPFTVHGYGLMIALGMIAALFLADHRAGKKGLNGDYVWQLSLLIMLFGWLGGKIMFCIVEWQSVFADPGFIISSNGFVVYGGIITGVLTAFLYCRFRKVSFREYADLIIPEVSLAQGIGRIGCFLAGCCYGRETSAWYGVVFHNSPFAPAGVRVIPTQLISAAGNLLFFAILLYFSAKTRIKGHVLALYLMLYSFGRFLLEFLRGDPRGNVGPLSTSQFVAIFIFIAGAVLWVLFSRMADEAPDKDASDMLTEETPSSGDSPEEELPEGYDDSTADEEPSEGYRDPSVEEEPSEPEGAGEDAADGERPDKGRAY